jgi:hypothetical protein
MILQFLNSILNGELKSTALNQLWRLISGPLVIFLIPIFLSAEVQGYWFLIISVGAIAAFADFGFSTILMQFSAHEFAFLKFNSENEIVGNQENLNKLSSLFMFALKWTALVTIVILPITYITGIVLIGNTNTEVDWKFPWLLYNIGAIVSFTNSIVLAFFEGCDSVKKVQTIRLKITVLSTIIVLVGLILNFNLYALSISLLVSSIYGSLTLYNSYRKNIHIFYYKNKVNAYSWGPEIFPLLRKYVVSWSSGFIIFQLFTPIMFHFHGAIEAGKIGISIAIFTSIFSVSNIWTTSIIPKINMAIAKSDFVKLNYIFNKYLLLSICTYLLASIVFHIIYFIFHDKFEFFDRFVNITALALLNFSWFAQLFIHNLSIYLRSHKEEPLLVPSIFSAIYVIITTILSAYYLSIDLFFIGFATLFLWFLPWVIILYSRKKRSTMSSIKVQ